MSEITETSIGALFKFCPACASPNIHCMPSGGIPERKWVCPDCGFQYYHNVAASGSIVVGTGRGIVLLERAKDPRKGTFTVPGGFVNPNEGAGEAALRECLEEIGWAPTSMHYLGSYPNQYPYAGVPYWTCDTYFWTDVTEADELSLHVDVRESTRVVFVPPDSIPWNMISFESTRRAIREYIKIHPQSAPKD